MQNGVGKKMTKKVYNLPLLFRIDLILPLFFSELNPYLRCPGMYRISYSLAVESS